MFGTSTLNSQYELEQDCTKKETYNHGLYDEKMYPPSPLNSNCQNGHYTALSLNISSLCDADRDMYASWRETGAAMRAKQFYKKGYERSVSTVPTQQHTDLYMFRLIFESMVFMSMGSEMIS